jgi:hypothetical protein
VQQIAPCATILAASATASFILAWRRYYGIEPRRRKFAKLLSSPKDARRGSPSGTCPHSLPAIAFVPSNRRPTNAQTGLVRSCRIAGDGRRDAPTPRRSERRVTGNDDEAGASRLPLSRRRKLVAGRQHFKAGIPSGYHTARRRVWSFAAPIRRSILPIRRSSSTGLVS